MGNFGSKPQSSSAEKTLQELSNVITRNQPQQQNSPTIQQLIIPVIIFLIYGSALYLCYKSIEDGEYFDTFAQSILTIIESVMLILWMSNIIGIGLLFISFIGIFGSQLSVFYIDTKFKNIKQELDQLKVKTVAQVQTAQPSTDSSTGQPSMTTSSTASGPNINQINTPQMGEVVPIIEPFSSVQDFTNQKWTNFYPDFKDQVIKLNYTYNE